jgi:hypothetical protein
MCSWLTIFIAAMGGAVLGGSFGFLFYAIIFSGREN